MITKAKKAAYQKRWRDRHPLAVKLLRIKLKPQIHAYQRMYRQRPEVKERNKIYQKIYMKSYREKNIVQIRANMQAYRKRPEVLLKQSSIAYKQAMRKYVKDPVRREKANARYRSDINFRLGRVLRSRLSVAIRGSFKSGSAVRDLGITIQELRQRFELLFAPGMSWDNWGIDGWHIDHIIPLSSFDLTDPIQAKQACHYTNLHPLWATDNLRKHNKLSA